MSRGKVSAEEKIEIAQLCSEGKLGQSEAARRYGLASTTVNEWVKRYQAGGAAALEDKTNNQRYSEELKLRAVEAYLSGEGSLIEISTKYGLRTTKLLRNWIKVYNSGKGFQRKMSGGSRMKQTRNTTKEERIAIVRDCLENDSNYGETAIKYQVSYQQVYTWVKKYKEHGEAGLEDLRGKRTQNQEPRSEVEEMKIRIAQLEHELYMTRMERDLIKKAQELERRDAFHK